MKHILVTGCKGQLGNEIQLLASKYDDTCKFYFTDKDELDITDRKAVYAFIEQNHISIVVNCAAFTAVDKAESNEELCNLLNNIAPGYLAEAVASVGGTMIQVSTDYVFDGNSCKPYKEEDATNPQTVYGRTKLAGEENVIRSCAGSMVIRTAWLYSTFGNNFVKTMGLQVALARIGTAGALAYALPFAKAMGGVSASVGLGAALLCAGMIAFIVYCVMDKREDASAAAVETEPEEGFKFSDLSTLFGNIGFWYVAVLCLMFYAGVFPFLKFATKLMVMKYEVDANIAGLIPAMLPFGTIFLTPLFGSIYDKYGKGATLMLIGSCLLTLVHITFASTYYDSSRQT
jgi:hypothetical protein